MVATIPKRPYHRKLILLAICVAAVALYISILSFIKSNPINNNQNPITSFALCSRFSLRLKIKLSPQRAIKGNAKADILKLPNHMSAARKGRTGEPILAQKINPIELFNVSTPAPAKARTSNDKRLLLCKILVVRKPVNIEAQLPAVYFLIMCLRLFHHNTLMACSKRFIPKSNIPTPAKSWKICCIAMEILIH